MSSSYPAGPSSVPERLTEPSPGYRRHAWLAMLGLFAFIAIYFGLLFWFAWTAYRLLRGLLVGSGGDVFFSLLAGLCAAFLAVFMTKALIFNKRARDTGEDLELKPQDQPELFAFLHRLADEAGAPRPHRVFLSARVNACVFYDLSLVNLIFPSKKNLEIGLALVNVLNLGELKAVLAHEFGHFAQRTMAVGRWVYVAQQVAGHIIAKRDALDAFLAGLSRFDFRIAWVGWLLSLIVWSIRSLVEIVFRGVVLAQRALSREMEYQADLVAASLTGSDALVHALHKLGAADDAWNRALQFANQELRQERAVDDLFAVQTRVLEHMRIVLADPEYGAAPRRPEGADAGHRVFREQLAPPPQMWSTHPSNEAREANIKRTYIACDIDDRPATVLLHDVDALKRDVTRRMISGGEPPKFAPIDEALRRLDEDFAQLSLSRRYRGTYLGRSIVRDRARTAELFPSAAGLAGDPLARIDALYPPEQGERIERLRELEGQHATLVAIRDGDLRTSGGIVQWRGAQIRRKALPGVIAELEAELTPLREAVAEHDRQCRGAHLAAAEALGPGWGRLLRGQLDLLHYAEHAKADILDAYGLLHNTYEVVTADRRVSAAELRRLVASANQVHDALANVNGQARQVVIDERLAARLGVSTWPELLPEHFSMSRATEENINSWMNVVDGWVNATVGPLSMLRAEALEALLQSEDDVARQLRDGERLPEPARTSVAPREYITLLPGKGRRLQKQLGWWDRFQTADGWLPGAARVAVAGSIVGAVVTVGGSVGQSTVTVFNGLAREVVVEIDDQSAILRPFTHQTLTVPNETAHRVEARTTDTGEPIESFEGKASEGSPHLVYNVAGAAPLVQWTAVYGAGQEVPPTRLGGLRWSETEVDHVFEEPPASISSKSGGGTRTALSAMTNAAPMNVLSAMIDPDGAEADAIALTHARWDSAADPHTLEWMWRAHEDGKLAPVLEQRLVRRPDEVLSLRLQQDIVEGAAHDEICAKHRALAAREGAKPALQYVALRCIEDDAARNRAVLDAYARWPKEPWLMLAAGYAHAGRGQWREALPLLERGGMLPEASAVAMLDIARIKRGLGSPSMQELEALAARSSYLGMLLALESGKGTEDSPAAAYRPMVLGEFDRALAIAGKDPQTLAAIRRLVAASDGASADMVRSALEQPVAEIKDDAAAWWMLALAERTGSGDVAALRDVAMRLSEERGASLAAFHDAVRRGASVADAEAALGEADMRTRGVAYATAVVLLGTRCPPDWRTQAKWLLMPAERPYFL